MRQNNILKQIIIPLIFTFVIGAASSFAQDKVVAIVNNDVITQKDLNDFANFMRMQLSAEHKGAQLENKIQSMKLDLLDRLIEDKLILQEAKNQKIRIDESRIKSKIEEIKSNIGSDAEFQKSLKQQGLVQADVETRIREQLLMYTIIDIKVRSRIVVDPSEITDFYNRNKGEFKSREQREIESIVVEDEATAMQISDKLKDGRPIEEVSEKYKVQINKFSIGKGEELKKDIEVAIYSLNINEASKPVKIDNKFYVFRLKNIIPSRQQSLDEARDTIQSYVFDKKMQEELGKWLNELKEHSYIRVLSS